MSKQTQKKLKACTSQINLPFGAAMTIRNMADSIPDADLDGDGRDTGAPHITLRWGIDSYQEHGLDDKNSQALQQIVNEFFPFYIKLGKTNTFEPSKSSGGAAVVYVNVVSPILAKLHRAISERLSCLPYDFDYKPHATVAYIKDSLRDKYEDNNKLEGHEFMARVLTFSDKFKQITEFKPNKE